MSATFLDAYKSYLADLWLKRSKIGCLLLIAAVPGGIILDSYIYPEEQGVFLVIRLATMLLAGGILALHFRPWAKPRYQELAFAWMILAAGHVVLMIGLSDGITSSYYIGLILVIAAIGLLLPVTFRECLEISAMILAMYFGGCALHAWGNGLPIRGGGLAVAVNNSVFLVLLTTISLVGCYVTAGYRFNEFKSRFDLDQNKRELEASYHKLSELDRTKTRFFANISHELRTPLTLIVSPLDHLRNTGAWERDPKMREMLDLMYGNAMRLLALINDLLDLVKLEDGKLSLRLEPVDLHVVLLGLTSSMRSIAEQSQLELKTDLDGAAQAGVLGDKDRLEKIFINLIFNAIKFTPKGGRIRVGNRLDGNFVLVDIADTGIGIAEENLGRIFERFWQEEGSSARTRQGTGIGLALVQELVELHHGKVTVKSKKGEGTTFTVWLPRAELPAAAAGAGAAAGPAERPAARPAAAETESSEDVAGKPEGWLPEVYRKAQYYQGELAPAQTAVTDRRTVSRFRHTLLLVEDEVDMQRFLSAELGGTYNVIVASDGESGFELAEEHQPKLIITDMMLPKMDGITLCRKIKSAGSILPTKIVLLTARADDRTKLNALEAGVDDFLTKPFSLVELKTRLANLLLTGQLERELQSQNQVLEKTLQQLRATEAQLIQSERLSALGTLSAGIMHEINNPVNFMLTALHYLRDSVPGATGDAVEAMDDIEGGLKRVRDIIADLRSFAYGGTNSSLTECDPEKVVRTAKRLLAQQLKPEIRLEEIIQKEPPLLANENQAVQLLVNLIQNAIDATASNDARKQPRTVRVKLGPEEKFYVLSVWDNGSGIAKENLPKLFDPFFTTKPVGKGMGLGLSISHSIVKQHHGEITARSEAGEFTEIIVRLPLQRTELEEKGSHGAAEPLKAELQGAR